MLSFYFKVVLSQSSHFGINKSGPIKKDLDNERLFSHVLTGILEQNPGKKGIDQKVATPLCSLDIDGIIRCFH